MKRAEVAGVAHAQSLLHAEFMAEQAGRHQRRPVRAGQVDMDVNYALEDYEVARGFVLSCQSFPVTDQVVVDFDVAD